MATPDTTAGEVMELSAALLNDTEGQIYNNTNMLPYLKIALKDLRTQYENAGIQVTNDLSAEIEVPANTTRIGFDTVPALPTDLIGIRQLWESVDGADAWVPVTQKDYIPNNIVTPITGFGIYAWRKNSIFVPESASVNNLKIDYIGQIFRLVVDENSVLGAINAETYLIYRTAGHCAMYIGENKTRADELYGEATTAFDLAFGIETKQKQDVATRRRPFRSSYKYGKAYR